MSQPAIPRYVISQWRAFARTLDLADKLPVRQTWSHADVRKTCASSDRRRWVGEVYRWPRLQHDTGVLRFHVRLSPPIHGDCRFGGGTGKARSRPRTGEGVLQL